MSSEQVRSRQQTPRAFSVPSRVSKYRSRWNALCGAAPRIPQGGEAEITAAFPAGVIGTTAENLKASAAGENHEHTEMYPGFAKIAREEGLEAVATMLEAIAVAEKQHEKRYLALAANIEAGTVFKRDAPVVWRCRNCGYLHEGAESPQLCPACAHPQAHFELLGENW